MSKVSALLLAFCLLGCGAEPGVEVEAEVEKREPCDRTPTSVEPDDYFLYFRVPAGLMADDRFDRQWARIEVHRIRPVYAHGRCRDVEGHAAVLVHGRVSAAQPSFDYRHGLSRTGEFSFQEALAWAGIDTFAPSLLGYGRSTRFSLDDPCNASLPTDRSFNPAINPLTGQTVVLATNPLAGQTCAHSSPFRFGDTDLWVRDIGQAIDDARWRSGLGPHGKVSLVAYSFGAQRVGRALDPTRYPEIVAKVDRAVFMAPLFYQLNRAENLEDPDPAEVYYTFPLLVSNPAAANGGGFAMSPLTRHDVCSGHIPANANAELHEQSKELDPIGAAWGGTNPAAPTGVVRSPTFATHGLNTSVAGRLTTPTLVLGGLDDVGVPAPGRAHACGLFKALTSSPDKVLVQLDCASHSLHFEGCTGPRCCPGCNAEQPTCATYDGTCPWKGPHTTVAKAVIEWILQGTFDGKASAEASRYTVDASGLLGQGTPACDVF